MQRPQTKERDRQCLVHTAGGDKTSQSRPDYDKHADEAQDTRNPQRAAPMPLPCLAISGTSHTPTGRRARRLLERAALIVTQEGERELSHQRVPQIES